MFERRLRFLLVLFGLAFAAIVLRLGQLQVLSADLYRRRAERALLAQPLSLPFVRGTIRDRTGIALVSDEPCWDVVIAYDVIAADATADPVSIAAATKRWLHPSRSRSTLGPSPNAVEQFFLAALDRMWADLAEVASPGQPQAAEEIRRTAREVFARVSRVRDAVAQRRGFDAPVAEEQTSHALITGLDADRQILARERLSTYPWLKVVPSSYRRIADGMTPLAHVLGRVGRVRAEDVEEDPYADDPFANYRDGELVGLSGVEWAAEQRLRGRRGQVSMDRQNVPIPDTEVVAQNGEDLSLTIHLELQRRLYDLLEETVGNVAQSPGGAIVVVDVRTRELLALVSFPAFDPQKFDELYPVLANDTDRLPLRFRAVSSRYAPGSTIKPLVCLAGLTSGMISLDSHENCSGYLFDDQRDKWRCWEMHGTNIRMAHGDINVVDALAGSCNVFLFRLGQRLGAERICSAFDMAGIGRLTGIGLREENPGINPTPSWLLANKSTRPTPATARLYAIGQAEVSLTPIQVASLMAVYASGRYRPLTLIRSNAPTPEWTLPGTPEQWQAIRLGMHRVVNDENGTAHKFAHFSHPRYALAGKTGSATAHPWPTAYRIPYQDVQGNQSVARMRAGSAGDAVERFRAEHSDASIDMEGIEVASRWPPDAPPDGDEFSHAWFGGFLQEIDAAGQPIWSREPRVAFAALVEFGGSGARTSGPLARRITETLIEVLGEDLAP